MFKRIFVQERAILLTKAYSDVKALVRLGGRIVVEPHIHVPTRDFEFKHDVRPTLDFHTVRIGRPRALDAEIGRRRGNVTEKVAFVPDHDVAGCVIAIRTHEQITGTVQHLEILGGRVKRIE